MQITLLNHAGILLEYRGLRLVCDPWLEGNIYANSIRFLTPSTFDYQEFETVDYIWFSGEQPDRFSIPTLQKIPLAYREKITILYYQGFDKQLVRKCHELGFLNAIELTSESWVKLSDDFSMLSEAYGDGAWACFNSQEISVLNCSNTLVKNNKKGRKILKKIGTEPEWLLTQFNFNTYVPNFQTDEKTLTQTADQSLSTLMEQLDLFDPQLLIPIGDFIYYAHEENQHLTTYLQSLQSMIALVNQKAYARVALLFVNQTLELGKIPETEEALQKWSNISNESLYIIKNQSVEIIKLEEITRLFIAHFQQTGLFWIPRKVYIYLSDYQQVFVLDTKKGLLPSVQKPDVCHGALSSEVLIDCLKHPSRMKMYSQIGRVMRINKNNIYKIYNLFWISDLMNRKKKISFMQKWRALRGKKIG